MTLTIAILANNVAEHLPACFSSLSPLIAQTGARTLVLLNQDGDPATALSARSLADTVVERPFENFSRQRNYALKLAETDWLLFIDADERLTAALCNEIATVLRRDVGGGWRVPRRNFLFGHEMRHTGWWPDYQLRLMRPAVSHYDEYRPVHEYPIVTGEVYSLLNPLIHFNYANWGQFIDKQRTYAPLEAAALHGEGVRARPLSLIGQPLRELHRRLITYHGWRDGLQGIALSFAMALYRVDVYRRLRQLGH
ncbi:MAG: glycosyltransferase family 2 protein [Chloroflexota bacterium]